ncbi:hypothetical protein B0H16DRAFT_1819449 [Mycena metata]|uniref:Uncharacterized protein n=1 Tax=Mycena metata TaxID=1033252 RepID=A0AAD7J8E8_9AGAR|nr:hypothetical protein B0H16DRAFT_1819449 [Mycena metata]
MEGVISGYGSGPPAVPSGDEKNLRDQSASSPKLYWVNNLHEDTLLALARRRSEAECACVCASTYTAQIKSKIIRSGKMNEPKLTRIRVISRTHLPLIHRGPHVPYTSHCTNILEPSRPPWRGAPGRRTCGTAAGRRAGPFAHPPDPSSTHSGSALVLLELRRLRLRLRRKQWWAMRVREGRPALQRERRVRRVGCPRAGRALVPAVVGRGRAFMFALLPLPIAIPFSFTFAFPLLPLPISVSPYRVHARAPALAALDEASAPRAAPAALAHSWAHHTSTTAPITSCCLRQHGQARWRWGRVPTSSCWRYRGFTFALLPLLPLAEGGRAGGQLFCLRLVVAAAREVVVGRMMKKEAGVARCGVLFWGGRRTSLAAVRQAPGHSTIPSSIS